MSKFWQKKYISKYTGAEIDAAVAKAGDATKVTANPTLAGTEAALEGLQVGETKYKVDGGSDPYLIIKGVFGDEPLMVDEIIPYSNDICLFDIVVGEHTDWYFSNSLQEGDEIHYTYENINGGGLLDFIANTVTQHVYIDCQDFVGESFEIRKPKYITLIGKYGSQNETITVNINANYLGQDKMPCIGMILVDTADNTAGFASASFNRIDSTFNSDLKVSGGSITWAVDIDGNITGTIA